MKSFHRLSAPGSSALSIWQLRAEEQDCVALFGKGLPKTQNSFRLDTKSLPFDEALLWRRETKLGENLCIECHLHGGYGVAEAFRNWMQKHGWQEQVPQSKDALDDAFWQATSPLAARVLAAHRSDAFGKELTRLNALVAEERVTAIADLCRWNAWAEVLEHPPKLVLAGPPNVGKSSLFNLWNRAALATTQDGQGTTRDAVEVALHLGAGEEQALFMLSDTAGIGADIGELDRQAMELAWEQIHAAWKVIWVLDCAKKPSVEVLRGLEGRKVEDIVILNRCDLEAGWDPAEYGLSPSLCGHLGQGEEWIALLEAEVLSGLGPAPSPGTLIALKKSQREALEALPKSNR